MIRHDFRAELLAVVVTLILALVGAAVMPFDWGHDWWRSTGEVVNALNF